MSGLSEGELHELMEKVVEHRHTLDGRSDIENVQYQ